MPDIFYKYFSPDRKNFFNAPMLRYSPLNYLNDPFEKIVPIVGVFDPYAFLSEVKSQITGEIINSSLLPPIGVYGQYSEQSIAIELLEKMKSLIKPLGITEIEKEQLLEKSFLSYMTIINHNKSLEAQKRLKNTNPDDTGTVEHIVPNYYPGVMCYSARYDNLLLWAHYAMNHKGFVIGFKSNSNALKQPTGTKGQLVDHLGPLPIKYLPKRPFTWSQTRYCSLQNIMYTMFFNKSEEWQYEDEWRSAFSHINQLPILKCNPRTGEPIYGLVQLPETDIIEIILGVDVDCSVRLLAESFAKNRDWVSLKYTAIQLRQGQYQLSFCPIPSTPPQKLNVPNLATFIQSLMPENIQS